MMDALLTALQVYGGLAMALAAIALLCVVASLFEASNLTSPRLQQETLLLTKKAFLWIPKALLWPHFIGKIAVFSIIALLRVDKEY